MRFSVRDYYIKTMQTNILFSCTENKSLKGFYQNLHYKSFSICYKYWPEKIFSKQQRKRWALGSTIVIGWIVLVYTCTMLQKLKFYQIIHCRKNIFPYVLNNPWYDWYYMLDHCLHVFLATFMFFSHKPTADLRVTYLTFPSKLCAKLSSHWCH